MVLEEEVSVRRRPLTVGDVMSAFLISIPQEASLARAARLMDCYRVTGLPVVNDDGLAVGVISQRDLLREMINEGGDPQWRYRRVHEAMTAPALTIDPTAGLDEAARLMDARRVHRLLVLDRRGAPCGLLSRSDLSRCVGWE